MLMRPSITKKYDRKVRLLVTNVCSKNCSFCHNEGMPKDGKLHLPLYELKKILHDLKRYSSRIMLSGGDPLEYPYLAELISMLGGYEFDISVNTSLPPRCDFDEIDNVLEKIANIHVSIPNVLEIDDIESRILRLYKRHKMLQFVLNVPVTNYSNIKNNY